ncbi:LLM class flavin-dependent oxidoreductase [Nocardioides sp. NPDC059952]|uniref:LLM class flavin-dependent oxidoreductase n=1 Tax=Nocardioides sp. NPDC059952 TaxID=3347014 RepID=UPI003653106C
MRIGTVMWPIEDWPAMGERWVQAEQLGFETAWVYDHLAWRGHSPWEEAFTSMAAAAALTSTIRLGTLVTTPNFRTPIPTAAAIRSLDRISGGRITIGIGAGGDDHTSDGDVLGREFTPRERADRFAEWTRTVDLLLRDSPVTIDGEHWQTHEVTVSPGQVQQPRTPLWLAGNGPRGIRLAAEVGDGWIANPKAENPKAYVAERLEMLREACEKRGRDYDAMPKLFMSGFTEEPWTESADAFEDLAGSYAEIGITDIAIHWPRTGTRWEVPWDTFESIADRATRL